MTKMFNFQVLVKGDEVIVSIFNRKEFNSKPQTLHKCKVNKCSTSQKMKIFHLQLLYLASFLQVCKTKVFLPRSAKVSTLALDEAEFVIVPIHRQTKPVMYL